MANEIVTQEEISFLEILFYFAICFPIALLTGILSFVNVFKLTNFLFTLAMSCVFTLLFCFAFLSYRITIYEDGIGFTSWFGRVLFKTKGEKIRYSEIKKIAQQFTVEIENGQVFCQPFIFLNIYTQKAAISFPSMTQLKKIDVLSYLRQEVFKNEPDIFLPLFDCSYFSQQEIIILKNLKRFSTAHVFLLRRLLLGLLTNVEEANQFLEENNRLAKILEKIYGSPLSQIKELPIRYSKEIATKGRKPPIE